MISMRQPVSTPEPYPHACRGPALTLSDRRGYKHSVQSSNPESETEPKQPSRLEEPEPQMLATFCTLLMTIIESNTGLEPEITSFNLNGKVTISVECFVERIASYMKCSPSCYVMAIILLDRLQTLNQHLFLTSQNIHKLLAIAVIVAAKYCDDDIFKNSYYAKVTGVSLGEFNRLELQFLALLGFDVYVSDQTFEEYRRKLGSYLERKAAKWL